MKNIIKRGTSLLLVLAMLLSFAAVVGAADERLPAEGEKPVTLSLDSVVLRQGSTDVQYVPVRLTIEPGFAITGFQLAAVSSDESAVKVTGFYPKRPLKIYEDGSVNYDETIGTIFGRLYSNYVYSENKDPVQKFACANAKGVTSETISARAEDGMIKEPDLAGYIGVKVKDGAQSGVYQLSIIPNASRDTDKRNDIVFSIGTQNPYTDAYATLNAGTAIVLPEGASLPTVILTDDTFAVPTWAQMKAGEDIYPLAGRMKIVGTDGKLYAVDPTTLTVEKDSVPTGVSVKNNQLEILTSTLRNDDTLTGTGTLRVTNAKAVGADISVTSATVSFKVNRAPAVATHVGFGYSGYNPVPADAKPLEASSDAAKDVQFNLGYGSLGVFDQYSDSIPGLTPTVDLKLYSDAFQTELQPEDEVITAKQVTMGTSTLTISKDLKKDVWCEIKTSWTNSDGSKTITGDTVKVHITSNYPQPKKAIISLTDGTNPVSSNIIEIPAIGAPDKTITYAVTSFIDQNGTPMDKDTTPKLYTVTPYVKGTGTSPVSGVTGKDSTITVTSAAVSDSPIAVTFTVMVEGTSIDAYLTDTTTPATLTIKKADPIASSLASMENGTGDYKKGKIFPASGSAFPTELPGIGEEKTVELVPLYVLDQYDAVMQTVAAANYKLYKVDGETKTPISADYAKFEDGIEDRVTLKLTNALAGEEGAKSLALTAGDYQIEATYNNKTAIANFTMTEATEKTYVATVTAEITTYGYTGDKSVKTLPVPYAHGGTAQQRQTPEITYTATVTDQYGKTPADGTNVVAKITSIKLGTSQADYINDNSSKFIVINGTTNAAKLQVTKELATVMNLDAADSVVVHVGLTVTVDGKPATVESVPDYTFTTDEPKLGRLGVYLRTDEDTSSALGSWSSDATNNPEALTVVAPAGDGTTRNVLDFAVYDQYRRSNGFAKALTKGWLVKGELPTGMTFGDKSLTAGSIYEVTVTKDAVGKTFTITAPAAKNVAGTDWTVKVTAVAVEFVKTEDGKTADDTFQLSDYLNRTANEDGSFSAEYDGSKWEDILAKKDGATVYIKTAEGEQNTPIDDDNLSLEVTKDGAPVGMDVKANAGSYQVKLVYTDAEGQKYTVDEKTFTITPKTVKITVTGGTITKEYDGTQSLVLSSGVTLTIEGNPADLTVDPNALQYASADASTAAINIELVPGKTCLTGAAAANYNVSPDGLTGTIIPRKLIVTPKAETFEYGENDKITTALTTEFDYAGKNGDLPSGLTPTFNGSMKLQQNNADVTVYNAGTYNVVNNNLSAGTNYEIEFPATSVQWTINRKLLTKVKNSGLPSSPFGANTDQGCISHLLRMFAKDADGSLIEGLRVSDFVDESKLSFPSNAVVAGPSGKQYPVPKTYTLTVTNKPTKDIGKNYRVDDTTEYEFDYTVNRPDASLLTVTLTGDTYTYNGMEQGPTVSVTYKNQANDTLDLTSLSSTHVTGTTKATDAGTYTITVTSDLVSGSKTVTWKINPKNINGEDIEVVLQALHYTGEYVDLRDAVVKLSDKTLGVDLVKGVDWDFVGACGTTNAGGSQTVSIYGKGNYGIPNNHRAFTVTLQKAGAALDDTQLEGKQATRNKTNVIELSPKYKLAENPTIEVVGSSEWLDNNSVSAEYKDGKIKITLNVKDGPVTETSKVRLKLTIAGTSNYEVTVKEFDVKIIEKLVQNFTIAPATGDRAYSYSEGSVQMVATNAVGTVHWQIATDTSGGTAKIDSNGKLELGHPGTVKVVATANETDAYAAASQTYVLTITKGQVTITASSATMTANDPLPGFSATASGLNPNDSVSEVFQTLTASAATDGKTAGTYAVNASATLKTDFVPRYTLRFVPGTLTVNPAQTAIDVVLPIIIGGNTCANGYANCACESFYDLDASRWYHEAIDWAYSLGLMNGTTKSTFGPNAAATRAQTWTMLARIAGQDTGRSVTWYEVGQKWAMGLGITDGTNPMGSLTREQLAAMLYRYVGSPAVNGTLTFTDSANVSTWARNAMIWAVQNGILDGVGGNRLNPKGTTTRAQAAAIFMRFSKLINK